MCHARTARTLGLLLLLAGGAYAATLVPDSSILPARLETSVSSQNAKAGELIRARIMQAVPLLGDATIPAGSILTGKVTAVQVAVGGEGGRLAFRFDTLHIAHENVLLTLRLRAIASDQEVRQAQLPRNSDPSASSNSWTTVQIGGDVVYRGGGGVRIGPASLASRSRTASWCVWTPIPRAAAATTARASAPKLCGFFPPMPAGAMACRTRRSCWPSKICRRTRRAKSS